MKFPVSILLAILICWLSPICQLEVGIIDCGTVVSTVSGTQRSARNVLHATLESKVVGDDRAEDCQRGNQV